MDTLERTFTGKTFWSPALLALGLALLASRIFAGDSGGDIALLIEAGGQQHMITTSALDALPRVTVQVSFHGDDPEDIPALTLPSVLALAGVKAEELHNNELGRVVLVEASDGYAVAFGIAELDPNISGRQVFISSRERPQGRSWRILVPGDGRGARWVRDVARIRVIEPVAPRP
jgi:hypothetical protein